MYEYKATLIRVVDGDTIHLDVDLGFYIHINLDCRLKGINTPEISKRATKVAGLAAKAELERLFTLGPSVVLRSSKPLEQEKYGRWLADVFVVDATGAVVVHCNQHMLDNGFAVPFMV